MQVGDTRKPDKPLPDVVGVVPMAGRATRLPDLPCSKEIVPLDPGAPPPQAAETRPQAVCEHVLGGMRLAAIDEVYVVIRDGKWDIPAYLGDGSRLGLNIAYLMMGLPWGTPYSVDQAYAFVRDKRVALGFPDMCFHDLQVFRRALDHQTTSGADVVLGVFPADRPHKVDMLAVGADHRVEKIVVKPASTTLHHTWGVAVWTPAFSEFLHSFLAAHSRGAQQAPELFVGDVVRAAMQSGMDVQGVEVSSRPFLDIGTAEDLARARDATAHGGNQH
jgi:glucose-1-phosphate thymidylyltransferase